MASSGSVQKSEAFVNASPSLSAPFFSSRLSCSIPIHIPYVASPMDTISEAAMAVAMAALGGADVIHSNTSPAAQFAILRALKKLVLSIERRLHDNLETRMKYPDQPERFADSEVALHKEAERVRVLAGAPELYPDLVSLNAVPSIASLVGHDNPDLATDVAALLADLTDADALEDNDELARTLIDALVDNNTLELIVQNLARLSESDLDKAAAIYNTLATIENMVEVRPSVAELV